MPFTPSVRWGFWLIKGTEEAHSDFGYLRVARNYGSLRNNLLSPFFMAERREYIEVKRGTYEDGSPFEFRTKITTVAGVQPAVLKRLLDEAKLDEGLRTETVAALQQVTDEDLSEVFVEHVPRVRWAMHTWLERHPAIAEVDTGHGITHGELYAAFTTQTVDLNAKQVAARILREIVVTGLGVGQYFKALAPQPEAEAA